MDFKNQKLMETFEQKFAGDALLTTNGFLIWTPWLHPFITVYFHVKINKRPSIPLPPFVCISLLIYTAMVFVLSNGKCVLPTP